MNCSCKNDGITAGSLEKARPDLLIKIIPKEFGDSVNGSDPVRVGLYRNAIITYRADGLTYLFDENGYFALFKGISAEHFVIDTELSETSNNALSNKTVYANLKALEKKYEEVLKSNKALSDKLNEYDTKFVALKNEVAQMVAKNLKLEVVTDIASVTAPADNTIYAEVANN